MKTYSPSSPGTPGKPWLKRFFQLELLAGCFCLFVGGFYVRTTGSYAGVLLGLTLVSLALVHLVRNSSLENSQRRYDTDRLYVRLKEHLPDGYGLAFDVPIGQEPLDYLVIGHSALFVINTCDRRGQLSGTREEETWDWTEIDQEQETAIPNPFRELDGPIHTIRERLESALDGRLPVRPLVLLSRQQVEGTATEIPGVLRLGEVAEYIEEHDDGDPLDVAEKRTVEETLGLADY